jgi:uncharacterized protein YqgQ
MVTPVGVPVVNGLKLTVRMGSRQDRCKILQDEVERSASKEFQNFGFLVFFKNKANDRMRV